jgi:hypothetical protein
MPAYELTPEAEADLEGIALKQFHHIRNCFISHLVGYNKATSRVLASKEHVVGLAKGPCPLDPFPGALRHA